MKLVGVHDIRQMRIDWLLCVFVCYDYNFEDNHTMNELTRSTTEDRR